MTRVALFGGSFNPPHMGHVLVGTWVLETERADELWLLPTAHHPFGKSLLPYEERVALTQVAFAFLGKRARVETIESTLPAPSYTIDTVTALRQKHPDVRFALVVGTDILRDAPKWKEWDRLRTLVDLIPVRRAGIDGAETDDGSPLFPEISSTEIRARLKDGRPVDALVPAEVLRRIRERGLLQ